MTKALQLIVEGEGDVLASPVLVRRILESRGMFDVQIAQPVHRRGDLPKVKRRFSDFFQTAALEGHPVLCLLDFDCAECVDAVIEEEIFRKLANSVRPGYPFEACFLVKEFESLFLWDTEAVHAVLSKIRTDYAFPANPEAIRDAKGALSAAQEKGWSYKPTIHQAKLAAQVNLDRLRASSASFLRLEAAIERLCLIYT